MIIGIDASRANRPHKTGTEWYSYYLIRWLAKLDSTNQYILYTDKPLSGGLLDLTTEQHYENETSDQKPIYDKKGYQKVKSPYNNFKANVLQWPFHFFWTQGRLSWEMLFRPIDVLFIPAHTLPLIHAKKSVVTIHDIGFERDRLMYRHERIGPEDIKGRILINIMVRLATLNRYRANSLDYLSWSTKFALKHAKKIICVSEYTKREVCEVYGCDEKKIKVIYNGYNKTLYKKISDQEKIRETLKKHGILPPYLLYVGRLEKKKNTPALIEAFALLREKHKNLSHKLVLVGDASYGYDEVNYAIREFNLDDEVIMPGWVDEQDMPLLYNGADAFIFPTRYEGFGIPLLQAMASGVPIAASWASSIPEVVDDAALLFNPYDIKAIAEAMEKILLDDRLRNKLVASGNKRIELFSWRKCSEETLAEIIKL